MDDPSGGGGGIKRRSGTGTGTAGLIEPGAGVTRVSRDAPAPGLSEGDDDGGDEDDLFSVRRILLRNLST